MSSAPNSGGAAAAHQYFCYQCDRHVTIAPPPSPTADLVCPRCHGGFLEESDLDNPNPNPNPNPFFSYEFPSASPFDGFPFPFPSDPTSGGAAAAPPAGFDDLSSLFGPRSPDEFNPFAFLNNYITNLQSRGANIQVIFESPGGGSGFVGGGADFRLPTNLGDYFMGPGLEQLIQQLAENDPNRYGTPPASKSAVEGLPDIKITREMLASDSSQCAVCKDSFELDEVAKQIPCKHIYHKDCILPWLEMHNSCPVCRYELPTDDPDYENRRTGQNGNNSARNNVGGGGSQGSGVNDNNNSNSPQTPRTMERGFRISFPWLFRGFGSPAETSNSGGGRGGNNDGGNNNSANSGSGGNNSGSGRGGQATEEDLD